MSTTDDIENPIPKWGDKSPEEIWDHIRKNAKTGSWKLQLIYDEALHTVTLQGNREGLQYFKGFIEDLLDPASQPGRHHHFDESGGLTKQNIRLILQLMDE